MKPEEYEQGQTNSEDDAPWEGAHEDHVHMIGRQKYDISHKGIVHPQNDVDEEQERGDLSTWS